MSLMHSTADTLDLERLIYVKSEQEIFQHLGLPYVSNRVWVLRKIC